MRLAGVRTVLHIAEVNETERALLKRLGFLDLQETDIADNEMWDYCADINKHQLPRQQVMKIPYKDIEPGSCSYVSVD